MNKADYYYRENLSELLKLENKDINPRPKYKDGTPAHCYSLFGIYEKYDISKGEFPIPTLRNTALKMGIKEIFWIYQDQSNKLEDAHKRGITWWDEWDIGDGTIGRRYGDTVRRWDMMNELLYGLENDPFSRRHYIDLLQKEDLNSTKGLYPCAFLTHWYVREGKNNLILDMELIQRSNDYIMAGYINKAQYVALQMMVAGHLGYDIGVFAHNTINLHIYDRHIEAAKELLNRTPIDIQPTMRLKSKKNFYDYTIDDFEFTNLDGIEKLKSNLEIAI